MTKEHILHFKNPSFHSTISSHIKVSYFLREGEPSRIEGRNKDTGTGGGDDDFSSERNIFSKYLLYQFLNTQAISMLL